MKNQYKNATLSETLDNLVGSKGIRTEVSVEIKPSTVPVLIGSVMVAIVLGVLIAGLIQKKLVKG